MARSGRLCAAACVLACMLGLTSAAVPISNPTTFASLQRVLGVTVSVQNNGLLVATNTSCTAQFPGAACLAKVDAHNSNQKVVINYSVLPNATLDATSHVILKACYSPIATRDRAWRKANNILVLDHQCSFAINTPQTLPPTTGSAMWSPPDTVPNAAYFIRAYAVCKNATFGSSPCGFGNSVGYFQINQIDSRPHNMIGAIIGMAFAGPVIFFVYFAADSFIQKKRKH